MLICAALGSSIVNLNAMVPQADKNTLSVQPLGTDKHASEFLISIPKSVPVHIHRHHTEIVYVIDGEGKMTLNDELVSIKKGDYVRIPENTPHGVVVTSDKPLKVLSVQTPEFKGIDRHLVK